MPLTEESRVRSAIPRITDVIGRHHAVDIAVCKQAELVALHLTTSRGVVVVTTSLHEFTQKCRGPRDHNGNRLPLFAPFALPEKKPAEPNTPPAEVPGEKRGPRTPHPNSMPEEELQKYIAAAKDVAAFVYPTKSAAARAHGISENCFHAWIRSASGIEHLRALKPAEVLPA